MKKVAVFVEGQSEVAFVHDYLLKLHDYADLYVTCYTLSIDENFKPFSYPFGSRNAVNHYEIICCGGDAKLLSVIQKRANSYFAKGFSLLVGLRDMYCQAYLKRLKPHSREVSPEVSQQMISAAQKGLAEIAQGDKVKLHFATMEIEAWILGLCLVSENAPSMLSRESLKDHFKMDIETLDPESKFLHPAEDLRKLLESKGSAYKKGNEGQIKGILSEMSKADYLRLADDVSKCESFSKFHQDIYKIA